MRILYLDIETAPNLVFTWGLFNQFIAINQIVKPGYTLCFAAKWEDEKEVFFASVHHDGNETMMKLMHKLLDEADVVVHYNGKKFDMPIINREFVLLGLVPPTKYKQCDLYQTVRMNFKFVSNKLDFVSQQLGIGCKVSHKGMDLWAGCMEGNEADWKVMKRYNIQDVRLLPRLKKRLLPWINWPAPLPLYAGDDDERACPNCGKHTLLKRGVEYPAKVNAYQRLKCSACGTNARGRLPLKNNPKPGAV